jgi:hypothetical protein
MKTTITIAYLLFFSIILSAQQKLQHGSFRCFSMVGPMMRYLDNPETVKQFSQKLDSTLYVYTGKQIVNPNQITFQQMDKKLLSTERFTPVINQPSISVFLIEYSPQFLLTTSPPTTKDDSAFLNGVVSCMQIGLQITDQNGNPIIQKEIEVYLKKGISNGIGLPLANLVLSPKGFLDLCGQILPRLVNNKDSLQTIEMRAGGVFAADNFMLAANAGKPRIQVNIKKNSAIFLIDGVTQLLRWDVPTYQEIIETGKNKTALPDSLMAAIKKERKGLNAVFIYLKQDLRDGINNKNYEVVMPAKYWFEQTNAGYGQTTLNVLEGSHHRIVTNKDTIGYFDITKGGRDTTKLFSLHKVSNGFDTTSITQITETPFVIPLVYDYQISGVMNGNNFKIRMYGNQYIREIWVDGELVATIFGDIVPEKIVLATAIENTPLLNFLILFSYQSYFSSKQLSRYSRISQQLLFSDYLPIFGLPDSYQFYPHIDQHFENNQ